MSTTNRMNQAKERRQRSYDSVNVMLSRILFCGLVSASAAFGELACLQLVFIGEQAYFELVSRIKWIGLELYTCQPTQVALHFNRVFVPEYIHCLKDFHHCAM